MNVYDFDKTIFYPDSSYSFVRFCLKKRPGAVLSSVPRMAVYGLGKMMGLCRTKELKQAAFSFLKRIPDIEELVEEFWAENWTGIGEWYLQQKREDDVIISASPEFLLRPVAERLGVTLLGTRMDSATGQIEGENCHDEAKVVRFHEAFGDAEIDGFYSDSNADLPLARLAKHAFKLNHYAVSEWKIE